MTPTPMLISVCQARKQFFLEKKHQKTFNCLGRHLVRPWCPAAARNKQKFFVSLFSKKKYFLAALFTLH
jgi:hypothetical protein